MIFKFFDYLGKPEAPYNCTLANQTTESLAIECTPGFDGGQAQTFLLEVYDQNTGELQANISSREPQFTVRGLEPGKVLNMILYAFNPKGRSDPARLEGFTLKVAEKQTGKLKSFLNYFLYYFKKSVPDLDLWGPVGRTYCFYMVNPAL